MKNAEGLRRIRFFTVTDCADMEEYLEKMARKGRLLQSVKSNIYTFEKAAPQELRYAAQLFVNRHSSSEGFTPDMLAYIERCAAAGYRFVCAWKNIAVFVTTGEEPLPFMTSDREKLRLIKKHILAEAAAALLAFMAGLLYVSLRIYRGGIFSVIADNAAVLLMPLFLFGVPAAFRRVIRGCRWAADQKARLRRGEKFHYPLKTGRPRMKKGIHWTAFGLYAIWIVGNLAVLRDKGCYMTMLQTVSILLLFAVVLSFMYIWRTRRGLRKLPYSLFYSTACFFLFPLTFYLVFFFPKLTDNLNGGYFKVRGSALAGYAEFSEEFFWNKSSGSVTVFTTDIDPLRKLYLKSENVLSLEPSVYDSEWEADTVTDNSGVRYVFYGDSVVRLPADFLRDKYKIKGTRLYIDKFSYELDMLFTQTEESGEVTS